MSCCSSAYRLLDVGGTFVKCADGRQVPIPSDGSRDIIAAALTEAIGPVEGLKGVGIAIPGPFDYTQGIFHVLTLVDGERIRIRSLAHPERCYEAGFMDLTVVPADIGPYVIENLGAEPIRVHKTLLRDGYQDVVL